MRLEYDHSIHSHVLNRHAVLPSPVRVHSHPGYSGQSVTIAMIDSGFSAHPDLVLPRNRVLAYEDLSGDGVPLDAPVEWWHWHGTMTAVVAAGSGHLSDGIYRGVSPEVNLVLLKVSQGGRIREELVRKALDWLVENRDRYGIRIVNLSLGTGGEHADLSYKTDAVDLAAERAVASGIVVVAAAGNDPVKPTPPANAPSVIAVGGIQDDDQTQNPADFNLYHSSFGITADGVHKPEVVAPAVRVAGPILPGTPQWDQAEALTILANDPPELDRLQTLFRQAGLPDDWLPSDKKVTGSVERLVAENQVVGRHFKAVEGTSFAAPMTAAIIAQMLEANPKLTPAVVKNILLGTADRLAGAEVYRQGFGMVNGHRAVEHALHEAHHHTSVTSYRAPSVHRGKLIFFLHDDEARSVALAGDFNGWEASPLEKVGESLWKLEMKSPAPGRYAYKFRIDGSRWVNDPSHGVKEADPYGGLNSVLVLV
ncbi:MAG: S8 family serine peptidase [Candidatus Riflebacteria bacterium]|nr:S8 family serine peptidase [Candidatus Riflebacteria bacterium]